MCARARVCLRARVCVCVCVRACARALVSVFTVLGFFNCSVGRNFERETLQTNFLTQRDEYIREAVRARTPPPFTSFCLG